MGKITQIILNSIVVGLCVILYIWMDNLYSFASSLGFEYNLWIVVVIAIGILSLISVLVSIFSKKR